MLNQEPVPNEQEVPREERNPLISEAEIARLKRTHGDNLFMVEIAGDPKYHHQTIQFVFKRPSRKILGAVSKISQNDPVEATYVLLCNCMVFGDKEHLDDTAIFSAVSQQFEKVNAPRIASVKNL